jgi:hypothetical protein
MSYDAVQSGFPSKGPWPAGANTTTSAIDTSTRAEWVNSNGKGWAPVSSAFDVNNQSSITAEITAHVVTVPVTGIYRVSALAVATTATSGTLPAVTVTYTDADSATAESVALITSTATSAAGTQKSGELYINVKAGGTITFTGTSYATATYSAKLRTEYLG